MSSEPLSTRTRILRETLNLLESGGANSVRMSDIAKAAKISRQALYLHFPNRADLLIAATRHVDDMHDVQAQLAESRAAKTGRDRLKLWIGVWGNYIPTIYGVAKALLAMKDTDAEAEAAWSDRMQAVREGCGAVTAALAKDGTLTKRMTEVEATDVLWTLLSVRVWEQLRDCGWSQEAYIRHITETAERALID